MKRAKLVDTESTKFESGEETKPRVIEVSSFSTKEDLEEAIGLLHGGLSGELSVRATSVHGSDLILEFTDQSQTPKIDSEELDQERLEVLLHQLEFNSYLANQ